MNKKKKVSDLAFDSKQFPNFPRVFYLCRDRQIIAKVILIGYLHRLILTKNAFTNDFWIAKDPFHNFRKKSRERGISIKEDQIPNAIQRIHIFHHHDCIAEIDYRGRLELLESEYPYFTFHVEEVHGKIIMKS